MNFREKIKSKKFLVTSEIAPPKGTDITGMLANAELVKGRVDALNITDLQSSKMKLGSLAASRLLVEKGFEPIYQITCRDRNRLALQSDLLSAYVLGIRNVLVLTGDYPTLGDHPQAKPVFDLDSVQLLDVVRTLQGGRDMAGNTLKGVPEFCVGAVVNPGVDPIEPEIIKMEKKAGAGAEFFQTQVVYDTESFKKFLKLVKHIKLPIIAGIVPIKSVKMARFVNENIAGIRVPDDLINEIKNAKDTVEASIEITARIIKEFKNLTSGVHIMPIGWEEKVPDILDRAGL
jgi:methylenetetrahydrofolate reductase (NADPH)